MTTNEAALTAIQESMTRIERASWEIMELAKKAREDGNAAEAYRLQGKLEGIRLVVTYLDEEMTAAEEGIDQNG